VQPATFQMTCAAGFVLLQTYGPGGANPLLPGPQDNSQVNLGIDSVKIETPREQSYVVLAVRSPQDQAVDISTWKMTSGSTTWSFPAGRVLSVTVRLQWL
jgi:hypothetical protein